MLMVVVCEISKPADFVSAKISQSLFWCREAEVNVALDLSSVSPYRYHILNHIIRNVNA